MKITIPYEVRPIYGVISDTEPIFIVKVASEPTLTADRRSLWPTFWLAVSISLSRGK